MLADSARESFPPDGLSGPISQNPNSPLDWRWWRAQIFSIMGSNSWLTHTPAENDHFEGNFVPRNFCPNLWPHETLRLSFSALAREDITQNTTRLDTLSNCHPLPTGPSGVTTTTTHHPPHRIPLLWMLRNVTRVLALVPLRTLHSSVRNTLSLSFSRSLRCFSPFLLPWIRIPGAQPCFSLTPACQSTNRWRRNTENTERTSFRTVWLRPERALLPLPGAQIGSKRWLPLGKVRSEHTHTRATCCHPSSKSKSTRAEKKNPHWWYHARDDEFRWFSIRMGRKSLQNWTSVGDLLRGHPLVLHDGPGWEREFRR